MGAFFAEPQIADLQCGRLEKRFFRDDEVIQTNDLERGLVELKGHRLVDEERGVVSLFVERSKGLEINP